MPHLINPADLDFLLYTVLDAESLTQYPRYQDHDRTTFDAILDTSHKLAEQCFLPHNAKADQQEPTFDGTSVTTLPEVKEAWHHYAETGLLSARLDYDDGGMQLPSLVHMACSIALVSANPSTMAYPFLTSAAANVIHTFGDAHQRATYLPGMFDGRYAGTMALTEPNVGSSLGDLTTKAVPQDDGTFLIKGQKMFISGGDQEFTDNIIHLVLARVEGAPPGVKGISLFIVPKYLIGADGTRGARNDVQLAGLLHKMGYRGTTSTVLSFGEQDQCRGFLLGEANKGLSYMFKMMNEARIGVGMGSAAIGYRGYLASLEYARNRPQGRPLQEKDPSSAPINIIEHTDVKRMLLTQKAWVEGSLALCLYAAKLVDDQEAGQSDDAAELLDLLTPIVKSFPAWYGPKANDLAIQVLAGAGYTREYPVEQCYRDNRLNPIHEGTHGIQSLDLLGRKLWQKHSKGLQLLLLRVQATLKAAQAETALTAWVKHYDGFLQIFQSTVATLGPVLQSGRAELGLANSALFLDMMGKMVVAWLWLDMATHASRALKHTTTTEQADFYRGKLQAAQFFLYWELPEVRHQADLLCRLDDTCLNMAPEWF